MSSTPSAPAPVYVPTSDDQRFRVREKTQAEARRRATGGRAGTVDPVAAERGILSPPEDTGATIGSQADLDIINAPPPQSTGSTEQDLEQQSFFADDSGERARSAAVERQKQAGIKAVGPGVESAFTEAQGRFFDKSLAHFAGLDIRSRAAKQAGLLSQRTSRAKRSTTRSK